MPRKTRGPRPGRPADGQLVEYHRKRDFGKTSEPAGGGAPRIRPHALAFVIQKHAASHLHFDLRLELDGVMKSWAVPKGPHADPSVKRLAMQVEDHPMEYNSFEGTIPKGEYGGGTVMVWDRGTYTADEVKRGADEQGALRAGHRSGKLSITFHGERMQGSWALVRTDAGAKPKWLFFKHRDRWAREAGDLVAEHTTSVVSGRTMSEIASERDRVWRSNRHGSPGGEESGAGALPTGDGLRPMVPQPVRKLPADARVYEAWYGGERALAYATDNAAALLDEKGRDISARYRDIANGLARLAGRVDAGFVLDGELVGVGADARFHVFDLLLLGADALAVRPWSERRRALERLFERRRVPGVRPTPVADDAEALLRRAGREGWRGIFARAADAPYVAGKRTPAWQRLATPARYR